MLFWIMFFCIFFFVVPVEDPTLREMAEYMDANRYTQKWRTVFVAPDYMSQNWNKLDSLLHPLEFEQSLEKLFKYDVI